MQAVFITPVTPTRPPSLAALRQLVKYAYGIHNKGDTNTTTVSGSIATGNVSSNVGGIATAFLTKAMTTRPLCLAISRH